MADYHKSSGDFFENAKISLLLLVSLLAGCSCVKVIPEQTPGGVINTADNSQIISKENL